MITAELVNAGSCHVSIFDVSGRKLVDRWVNFSTGYSVIGNLPAGAYLVNIGFDNSVIDNGTLRFVKKYNLF